MATSIYTYPNAIEMQAIEQDLMPRLTQDRPVFEFFPQRSMDASYLLWEQKDDYVGLQNIRGLNGQPSRVKSIGIKQYLYMPGVYGEYMPIDEVELTNRRRMGTFGTPIEISDLVRERQEQLLQRRLDRIESIVWNLLVNGTFSVSNLEGGVSHTDTFPIQTYAAAVSWATAATSTPLADFRQAVLRARGHSVAFDSQSVAYMNQQTMNYLLLNTNSADLYGRRTAGLGTFNTATQVAQLLLGDNLPRVQVYEGLYKDDAGKVNLFIPDNKVVIIGRRPAGQTVGEYRFTRNANNPDLGPGPYTRVIDNSDRAIPRELQVHDGHNGGPVLYYPSAILVLSV